MDIVFTILGAFLIVAGLLDMFHSLLHPRGRGVLSHRILRGVWTLSSLTGRRFGSAAGPAGMVVVTIMWVALQIVGWALIYLPQVELGFSYGPGVNPSRYPDVMQALIFSSVTLSTLGFGDVVPIQSVIRMLAPVQALTGFALLTGALSWFTQAFPPLSRRRALAMDIDGLRAAGYSDVLHELEAQSVSRDLATLSSEVSKCVVDLVQHSESYFFLEVNPQTSLAHQLPYLSEVCDEAMASTAPDVGAAARRLHSALDTLGEELADNFLSTGGPRAEVFRAYARDHGYRTHDASQRH